MSNREHVVGPSYVIHHDGSGNAFFARNGLTGVVDFHSFDAATVINSAISGLSAGEVYLVPGTFNLSSAIIAKSNVNIRGAGRGETIIRNQTSGAMHMITIPDSGINITVSHLSMQGGEDTYYSRTPAADYDWECILIGDGASDITVDDVDLTGCKHHLIGIGDTVVGATRVKILNSRFSNAYGGFTAKDNSEDVEISNCSFRNLTWFGAKFISSKRCSVTNSYFDTIEGEGVHITDNNRSIVLDNLIMRNISGQSPGAGVYLSIGYGVIDNENIIISNVSVDNAVYGIDVEDSHRVNIINSQLGSCTEGIRVANSDDVSVEHCLVQSGYWYGMLVGGASGNVASLRLKVRDCDFINNAIQSGGWKQTIYLGEECDDYLVDGCTFIGNGSGTNNHIYIRKADGGQITNNKFSTIVPDYAVGVALNFLNPVNKCIIENNVFSSDLETVFHIPTGCSGFQINRNKIDATTTFSPTSVITGFTIRENTGYITANTGSATMLSGTTTVDTSGGLASGALTLNKISVTPQDNTSGYSLWATAVSGNTFRVSISAAAALPHTFGWIISD